AVERVMSCTRAAEVLAAPCPHLDVPERERALRQRRVGQVDEDVRRRRRDRRTRAVIEGDRAETAERADGDHSGQEALACEKVGLHIPTINAPTRPVLPRRLTPWGV